MEVHIGLRCNRDLVSTELYMYDCHLGPNRCAMQLCFISCGTTECMRFCFFKSDHTNHQK